MSDEDKARVLIQVDHFIDIVEARAASHAERIRAAVADHVFVSQETGLEHQVTVSIGVAAVSPTSEKIEELVHDADQALYRAKAAGRNRLALAVSEDGGAAPA